MSFPRYAAYKGSGLAWLGELPAHWGAKPIKAVASFNDEALPENTSPDFELSYVDIGSVSLDAGIERTENFLFADAPSRARRLVRDGDVIVSTVRTYLKAIAPIMRSPGNMVVSTGFAVIRPGPLLDSGFAKYALQSERFVDQVISRSTGVSYPAINASDLARIELPSPPNDEQSAIAAFLDRETGKIDALIAEQEKLLTLLAEKRQATISHAVTRDLNPSAPLKDSGVSWLGEVPNHWRVVRLKFIASVQTGIAKGKDVSGKHTVAVPYLRVANVQDGFLKLDDVAVLQVEPEQVERYRLRPGDVLMNEGGDFDKLGRGAIWHGEIEDCIHQNHVFAVHPHNVRPAWLNQVTSSEYAQFYFMGRSKQSTNLASISSTNIMELPVVLPPHEEQAEILHWVDAETERFGRLESDVNRALVLLKERRRTLIAAAVTGKIDLRNVASC